MSKGQFEILGLAIIVLLILIGFLFVIPMLGGEREEEPAHKEKLLVTNWISAYLGTTSLCKGKPVKKLIKDCAFNNLMICESGLDTCNELKRMTKELLETTFEEWGNDYFLGISKTGFINHEYGKELKKDRIAEERVLPLEGGVTVDVKLYLYK